MTVREFLEKQGIDIADNKCQIGNEIEGSNSLLNESTKIDFEVQLDKLNDDQKVFLGKYFLTDRNHYSEMDCLNKFNEIFQKTVSKKIKQNKSDSSFLRN